MAPPLRPQKDIEAIRKGLADGTIDAIATDHAPHSLSDKEVGFEEAPFGIIGLETAFPLSMKLVQEKVISLKRLVELLSLNPSKILGLNKGHLSLGSLADLAIFSTEASTIYDVNQSASKSRNSPFHQWRMAGKVLYTIVSGQVVFRHS
ncbi:MAG: amidohydrolase family protein [Deltaproteobacteria bacterium]|nr:amidohydrolase family protein [Deltaproteobacteria bacterium]